MPCDAHLHSSNELESVDILAAGQLLGHQPPEAVRMRGGIGQSVTQEVDELLEPRWGCRVHG
jgi:hypothetical protein